MKTEIVYQGSMPAVIAYLERHEVLNAESGAMVYMDATIDVEGKAQGGIMKGLGRMVTGESFFIQTLKANRGDGKVMLAPTNIGNIIEIQMTGNSWFLEKGAFLCSEPTVTTKVKSQGLAKGLFSKEGLFIIEAQGTGKLFLSSFGAIHKIELKGEEVIIDNGHMVAWESSLTYKLEKASSGFISSFTSGEGLVARFSGTGSIYIQTRNIGGFLGYLGVFDGQSKGLLGRLFG